MPESYVAIHGRRAVVTDLAGNDYVAFPPGRDFLLLPRAPARATKAGLALYDPVERRQRLTLRAGSLLGWLHAQRLAPKTTNGRVDWPWWQRLVDEVAEPIVGPVGHVAFRIPGSRRVAALLLDHRGAPVGFVKITEGPRSALAMAMDRSFATSPPQTFLALETLLDDRLDGISFRMLAPLPEGPHHPPPLEPRRVRAIIDEFQAVSDVDRPTGTPSHHVICHGDMTPRNLRVLADGHWVLFDWDAVRWGPRLADELRYWCAALVYRGAADVDRAAEQVVALLRERGDDTEVQEASVWSQRVVRRTYRRAERALHAAVGEAVALSPNIASGEVEDRIIARPGREDASPERQGP
jgi:hypothetical protein